MAIKIIHPGNDPEKEVFQGKCQKCRCIVECEKKDVKWDQNPPDNTSTAHITCPTCGNDYLWVKPKPKSILDGMEIKES